MHDGTLHSKPSTRKTENGDKETGTKGKKNLKKSLRMKSKTIELGSKPSMVDDGDE